MDLHVLPIINTILSLFAVIFLGVIARKRGLLPTDALGPINKLVFYIAIPSLLFTKISKAPFHRYLNYHLVVGVLISPVVVFVLAIATGKILGMRKGRLGTFVQASIHGNLGYMGLAVAFYALGEAGLAKAGLLASFLILAQNFLAIFVLQWCCEDRRVGLHPGYFMKNLLLSPIILACSAGILASVGSIALPRIVDNVLRILSGMALPVALLLIGASLSFKTSQRDLSAAALSSFLKLVLVPALGVLIYQWLNVDGNEILPGVILLASPTATVTYVMAREMGGQPDLATTAISVSTLLSGLTMGAWLLLLS